MKKEKNYATPMVLIQKTNLRASLLSGSTGEDKINVPIGGNNGGGNRPPVAD